MRQVKIPRDRKLHFYVIPAKESQSEFNHEEAADKTKLGALYNTAGLLAILVKRE